MKLYTRFLVLLMTLAVCYSSALALEFENSVFDRELINVKYGLMNAADEFDEDESQKPSDNVTDDFVWETKGLQYTHKSPTKAFLLSLVVPGAGQYYYGSKTKTGVFLGVEVLSLFMYSKLDGDGKDMEQDFMNFHDTTWFPKNYQTYLENAHGVSIDTGIVGFSHHLADSGSQQYYEMTGKYDQFAWGWDDAILENLTLEDYGASVPPLDLADGTTIPVSDNRDTYQQMRADANSKLDQSKRMLYVTIFNHLASAFEAFIMTKRHNDQLRQAEHEFAYLRVRANLKSFYATFDTPVVKVSYHF